MGGAMGKLSELRSRRGATTPVHPDCELEPTEDAEALTTPLLSAASQPQRRAAEERELPFHLAAVVRALAAAWHCLLGWLHRILPGGRRCVAPLSPLEAERLLLLRERAAVPYDAEAEEHQAALRGLWQAAFRGTPFPPGIKHPQWKEMGWQGEDPGTDFRGAGFISLEALLWMAQQRQATFLALMRKQAGVRSAWEYPFAAGGVNVAYMLTELLELRRQPPGGGGNGVLAPAAPAARAFLRLAAGSGTAFEELFVLSYRLLDVVWLEQEATYMEFPQVIREVRQRVEQCLASGGASSLGELQLLLLPPPSQQQQIEQAIPVV